MFITENSKESSWKTVSTKIYFYIDFLCGVMLNKVSQNNLEKLAQREIAF